ncbi:hypothetical protein N3K63_07105 [Microbacterium sp. W1N]|uniref:hypothetical protein n=1 Tax=Microbacterium festucae TaxID=2977531 RepID=UPI0021C05C39|nr:hypothetical protein [Microbacterium festucae]MCT9820054.1 hypothetical protein [Microbacterium festucae]
MTEATEPRSPRTRAWAWLTGIGTAGVLACTIFGMPGRRRYAEFDPDVAVTATIVIGAITALCLLASFAFPQSRAAAKTFVTVCTAAPLAAAVMLTIRAVGLLAGDPSRFTDAQFAVWFGVCAGVALLHVAVTVVALRRHPKLFAAEPPASA